MNWDRESCSVRDIFDTQNGFFFSHTSPLLLRASLGLALRAQARNGQTGNPSSTLGTKASWVTLEQSLSLRPKKKARENFWKGCQENWRGLTPRVNIDLKIRTYFFPFLLCWDAANSQTADRRAGSSDLAAHPSYLCSPPPLIPCIQSGMQPPWYVAETEVMRGEVLSQPEKLKRGLGPDSMTPKSFSRSLKLLIFS